MGAMKLLKYKRLLYLGVSWQAKTGSSGSKNRFYSGAVIIAEERP